MAPSFPIEFTGQRESKRCSRTGLHQMMGKSRKVSKGYSSGFVPDYRHAVQTMAESEGFGSSGRVDTEITASEDSCAPQRKCISLNVDSYDRFGVPIQVYSLSKMTESERKDLEVRLKRELQQIRVLQKKIASLGSNVTVTSPASDFHSCSDGQKRPLPDTLQRSVGVPFSQGKKRAPPGRNGCRTKRPAGRVDPVKQGILPQGSSNAMIMKQCETLLNRLMQHQHAWVFNSPVDVVKLNIPDYYNVIKHPMDLGTVKVKLTSGEYMNAVSFAADVRLTFKNAMTYNPKGNDVHYMAETLTKYFEVRWKPIEKKLPSNVYSAPPSTKAFLFTESETATPMPPAKRTKVTSAKNIARQEQPVKRVMPAAEKVRLSNELEALLAELPESIIDFLKENSFNDSQEEEIEIEIDIEALSDDTLWTLRKLLDDYMAGKQKNQAKAETCEMEIHNESGFSNSSVQPCKGNETLDEDVDIGGNDLPISSFPPVEIEKDTAALRNSKCSSSSSSSSESGSSSSDSDSGSGSSSGSESGGAKASVPINSAKETLDSGANLEHRENDHGDANAGTHSLNELNQVELESESKPVSVEGDGRQEGESAPSERQVSPDKLYRAALLRNRFAETILKAQEKTLGKDEKLDPELLRLEKEELERRRREEKARLRAEAKAAEEARKKSEAEAAAEAKRKRELEREAARLALQKMEKTVDINENCQFMEDLEMLRVSQSENLQGLIDETSPDNHSQGEGGGRVGSFKFQGNSNPLEQLGLFMKADDDEEEGDPQSVPTDDAEEEDDAEEGEID